MRKEGNLPPELGLPTTILLPDESGLRVWSMSGHYAISMACCAPSSSAGRSVERPPSMPLRSCVLRGHATHQRSKQYRLQSWALNALALPDHEKLIYSALEALDTKPANQDGNDSHE